MVSKYKIPENIKYISIIGEVKATRFSSHKKSVQRKDYFCFINTINQSSKSDEFFMVMYIYDQSYFLFTKELNDKSEDILPIIYIYMPKLYYEDFYIAYNTLIEQLKPQLKKIEIKNFNFKKRKTKRQIIDEIILLKKETKVLSYIIIALLVIIVYMIIFLLKNQYFN